MIAFSQIGRSAQSFKFTEVTTRFTQPVQSLRGRLFLALFVALSLGITRPSQGYENSATSPSALIDQLNAEFGNLEGFPPVFILDRDELEARYVLAGVIVENFEDRTKDIEKKRVQVITDYVKEKTGITLAKNDAINLEVMHSVSQGAFAYQWKPQSYNPNNPAYLCTVVPPSYNANQAQANMHILQMPNEEIYPDHNYSHLTDVMGREEAQLYSLLHEVGHCLDQKYLPEANSYQPGPSTVHQAESYAEVFGGMLMAQMGYTDIFERRTKMRLAYSWKLSPYFHAHPEFARGNPLATSGGTIYAIHKSLGQFAEWMSDSQNNQLVSSLTPIEMERIATNIVEAEAYSSMEFTMIDNYFKAEDKKAYLDRMDNNLAKYPDLFESPVNELYAYLKIGPVVTAELISDKRFRDDNSNEKITSTLNLYLTAENFINECPTKEEGTKSYLGQVRTELRSLLFQYSGFDVTDLNEKLNRLPMVAQSRLESLGCIN